MKTQYNRNAMDVAVLERPTIASFLDMDFYKLTMGQFVYNRYPDVLVKYAFKNRTKSVKLADIIDESELRDQLDYIRGIKLTDKEGEYLRTIQNNGKPLFSNRYINFLKKLELPDYSLKKENGDFRLEFEGPWAKSIYWETLALSTINELYYRTLTRNLESDKLAEIYKEGGRRLEDKVRLLKANPGAKFIEFGTRRRFSQEWQDKVVSYFKENTPSQMIGTSNVYLAMKHGLAPKGTMAHELFMVMSGIMHGSDDEIRASHNQVLKEWWDEYGKGLSIALTDTYGSDFFFRDITDEQARNYSGFRQDSGDASSFAKNQIEFYKEKGINPKEKLFVPSDGLEMSDVVDLYNKFGEGIVTVSGIGTSVTNDLGPKSLSLVIKAVESNGYGTVKLSDNPAKATGKPEDVARFQRIFSYDPSKYQEQECKY